MLFKRRIPFSILFSIFVASLAIANTEDFTATPPFLVGESGKPNVVIALDISGSMKANAYIAPGARWDRDVQADYDPDKEYFGYFEVNQNYSYASGVNKEFFYADASGDWDGNFLNWATMRRIDVVRKVLVGGKIRNRAGESIDGDTWYIIEGQNEPEDRTFQKQYSSSSAVSPYDDDTILLISDGFIAPVTDQSVLQVRLSDELEIGRVTTDYDVDRIVGGVDGNWVSVTYEGGHTYPTTPAVIATGVSFNGGQPVHARVRNVTTTGFEVRLEEWDYLDANHSSEDITYIVAEHGTHNFTVDGSSVTFVAGSNTTNTTQPTATANFDTIVYGHIFSTTPVVFSGVSTYNDSTPVVTRNGSVTTTSFQVRMQEEETETGSHGTERIDWIAIEPTVGVVDGVGSGIQIGTTGTVVNDGWTTFSFDAAAGFATAPIVAANMQTIDSWNVASVRYGDGTFDNTQVRFQVDEEQSADSEVTHANENIGLIAITAPGKYRIALGVDEEPTGIIQDNSGSLRFGLAVYNYDQSREPTSIYTGNTVHGGTFHPCYPDVTLPVSSRTNFDICKETHVKSPLSNILDVIEDHPLIWGTTPIAETLYEIKGYFAQENRNRNGHIQYYDNGSEGTSNPRNSYEISNAWDPYYYDELGERAPCAKSFVLHFNDGAPYRDFDGSGHPSITGDGFGNTGDWEMLDEMAYELRNQDCRTETGMDGHQGIISYYVYAALGEAEDNNASTKKMREAAVNGGFIDDKDDTTPNAPDPLHPADFQAYMTSGTNADGSVNTTFCSDPDGDGTVNEIEWDSNHDCNPDTFYFANDGASLINELNAVFESITLRAASGGASSVISASRTGEGAVYNAIFQTSAEEGEDVVKWVGDIHALMIDSAGNLRADGDADNTLDEASIDGYLDYCTEETDETRVVRVKVTTSGTRPTVAETAACSSGIFTQGLFDLDTEYIWSASDWLESLSDSDVGTQRTYTATDNARYIFTAINSSDDNFVLEGDTVAFTPASFTAANAGLLNAADETEADNIVTWIRGEDVSGLRSRQLGGVTKRLSDIIYSTPTVVGRPSENLDLLYGSESYRSFFNHYRHRRQVVYAGTNGGTFHAFNGGYYDESTKTFTNARGSSSPGSNTNYALGAELWAYVPYNSLPHLKYITDPSYGTVVSDHVYFVDLKPRIFDARIFPDDTDHPGGWGTILVGGMRLGGGTVDVDMDNDGTDDRTLESSIFIMDITNPDVPPKLLLEFSHPNLGFTTAIPAPIVHGSTDRDGTNGTWYLMLGSGPDATPTGFDTAVSTQNAHLFLLNLNNIVAGSAPMESSFGTNGILTLGDANSFISDLTPVDFGLDNMTTDAVYFGSVSGDSSLWGGKLHRIVIQNSTGAIQNGVSTWSVSTVYDAAKPITAMPSIGFDDYRNRWIYVGTGRFYTSTDRTDTTAHQYYGIKEPRSTDGSFSWGTVTSLTNVTSTQVAEGTGNLSSAPALTPALPSPATLSDLEERFLNYTDASSYLSGWARNLSNGENNFGAATLLGGTLTFTTYDPDNSQCTIEGNSRLYVLNALTGTADDGNVIGATSGTYDYIVDLGSMPATTPSLHAGDGYEDNGSTKAVIQKSDGSIHIQDQDNQNGVRSGEASWRQIQ